MSVQCFHCLEVIGPGQGFITNDRGRMHLDCPREPSTWEKTERCCKAFIPTADDFRCDDCTTRKCCGITRCVFSLVSLAAMIYAFSREILSD